MDKEEESHLGTIAACLASLNVSIDVMAVNLLVLPEVELVRVDRLGLGSGLDERGRHFCFDLI